MASMLAARQAKGRDGHDRISLSAPAMRSLLDSLASRLDEGRELSRYMTGLLIFLGLLGTFWGLLLTVSAIADVIGGMSVGSGDLNALFEQLKTGLGRPLKGMGTAFSSSMFGLAGALVLTYVRRTPPRVEEALAALRETGGAALGDGLAALLGLVEAPALYEAAVRPFLTLLTITLTITGPRPVRGGGAAARAHALLTVAGGFFDCVSHF